MSLLYNDRRFNTRAFGVTLSVEMDAALDRLDFVRLRLKRVHVEFVDG